MRLLAIVAAVVFGAACAARAADRLDAAQVRKHFEESFPVYLADHRTIVEIESSTGDTGGSQKMADWVKEKFEPLGYTINFRKNDKGTHVIANKRGLGTLRILILGHTDTVQPAGSLAKQPYAYDEATGLVKGPGAGDSKASVAQLLQFARAMNAFDFEKKYADMTFYFDAEEETGSATEDAILGELAQRHDLTLSVDSSPPNWGVNTERKWVVNYELNVEGITGHAGSTPQTSASATVELANQITRIMKLATPLGDPAEFTEEALAKKGISDHGQFLPAVSINIGSISTTNTKVNAVPKDAYAKLEVRGFKTSERESIDAEIKKIAAAPTVPGTKVNLTGPTNFMPAMEKTPEAEKLVGVYRELVKQLYGADITEWASGGVTIGNFTSRYIPTIDGLGVESEASHNLENERADVKTFVPRTTVMLLLLDKVIADSLIAPAK